MAFEGQEAALGGEGTAVSWVQRVGGMQSE